LPLTGPAWWCGHGLRQSSPKHSRSPATSEPASPCWTRPRLTRAKVTARNGQRTTAGWRTRSRP
jgi:hypothetical protein